MENIFTITKYSEAVTNLVADYQDGVRDVTLRWTNPTMQGQSGIQIIKDNADVTNIDLEKFTSNCISYLK